jgi:hypothetical protein
MYTALGRRTMMHTLTRWATLCLLLPAACVAGVSPTDDMASDDDDTGGGGGGGGGGGDGSGGRGDLEPPARGFQVRTPDLTIAAGEEVTYCYYTTLPVEAAAGVQRWESSMTPGSHHMILYLVDELPMPEGTLDDSGQCGFLAGDFGTVWSYAAQEPDAEMALPDGVGMTVAARQPVVMQMHYLNASDTAVEAHVTLNGHTIEEGAPYDELHAYITYNDQIDIGPRQEGVAQGSCAVPAGARFLTLSTHSHRFTTRVQVMDGSAVLVDTDDWEHPAVATWLEAPYHQFTGNLSYRCDYYNGSELTVRDGDSAETDEMCMAVGYFVGGDGPVGCLNSLAVPL